MSSTHQDTAGPRYVWLQQQLREAIGVSKYGVGDALPPERVIAEDFAVSRVTVRRAIDGLVDEGLVVRRHGAGTFVKGRVEKQFAKLSSFSEDMQSRGRVPTSRWIDRSEGQVTGDEALSLGLGPGSSVYRFARVREADGLSMALERSTIAAFALTSAEQVEDSLYAALEANGCRPVRALQRLRAALIAKAEADLLGIEPGAPVLFIERRGFLADGRTVETTLSWYRGDAYDFVAELSDT